MALSDIQKAVDSYLGLTEEEKAVFASEVKAGKKRGRKPGGVSPLKGKKLGPRKKKGEAASLDKTFPKVKKVKVKEAAELEQAQSA